MIYLPCLSLVSDKTFYEVTKCSAYGFSPIVINAIFFLFKQKANHY